MYFLSHIYLYYSCYYFLIKFDAAGKQGIYFLISGVMAGHDPHHRCQTQAAEPKCKTWTNLQAKVNYYDFTTDKPQVEFTPKMTLLCYQIAIVGKNNKKASSIQSPTRL